MAAVAQMQRTALEQATDQECLALVKNLTRTSLSVLGYLRELFPEDAFEERNINGKLSVKMLRKGVSREVDSLLDILEGGVFDALDRKYLRTLMLGVSIDPKNPDSLVESYIFQFTYPSSKPHLTIQHQLGLGNEPVDVAKSVPVKTKDEIKAATANTLRKMIVLTQSLEPLPNQERILSCKIDYWDDLVPEDYQPPHFRAPETDAEGSFSYQEEPTRLGLVDLETGHYNVRSKIRVSKEAFAIDGEPYQNDEDELLADKFDTDLEILSQATAETALRTRDIPQRPIASGSHAEIMRSGGPLVRATEELIRPAQERMQEMQDDGEEEMVPATRLRSNSQGTEDTQSLINHLNGQAPGAATQDLATTVKKRRAAQVQATAPPPLPTRNKGKKGGKPAVPAAPVEDVLAKLDLNAGGKKGKGGGKAQEKEKGKAGRVSGANSASSEDSLTPDRIQCLCGYNKSDGAMLECDFCNRFSHLPCAGYVDEDDTRIPERFKCADCRGDEPLDIETMRGNALARRTLVMMKEDGLQTMGRTGQALGGNAELGKYIIRRLRDEGFVEAEYKNGQIYKNHLIPWTRTQKKFDAYFQPGKVWVYADGRKVKQDPNHDNDMQTDDEPPAARVASGSGSAAAAGPASDPIHPSDSTPRVNRSTSDPGTIKANNPRKRPIEEDEDMEMDDTQDLLKENRLSASQDASIYTQNLERVGPARKKRKVSVAVGRIRVQPLEIDDE